MREKDFQKSFALGPHLCEIDPSSLILFKPPLDDGMCIPSGLDHDANVVVDDIWEVDVVWRDAPHKVLPVPQVDEDRIIIRFDEDIIVSVPEGKQQRINEPDKWTCTHPD